MSYKSAVKKMGTFVLDYSRIFQGRREALLVCRARAGGGQ